MHRAPSAAVGGHAVMTRFLMEKGADVAATNSPGATALHHAAAWGNVGVARGLSPFRTSLRPSPWRAPQPSPCQPALLPRVLSTLARRFAPPGAGAHSRCEASSVSIGSFPVSPRLGPLHLLRGADARCPNSAGECRVGRGGQSQGRISLSITYGCWIGTR